MTKPLCVLCCIITLVFLDSCSPPAGFYRSKSSPGKLNINVSKFNGTDTLNCLVRPEEYLHVYGRSKLWSGAAEVSVYNGGTLVKRYYYMSSLGDSLNFRLHDPQGGNYRIETKGIGATGRIRVNAEPVAEKNIRVAVNVNLELFGLMMQLDMGPDLAAATDSVMIENKKSTWRDWYRLGWKNYQRFRTFDSCGTMQLYRGYMSKGFFNDFFIGFLEQVSDIPHARLKPETDTGYVHAFSVRRDSNEAKANATRFLDSLNAFSQQIGFARYLQDMDVYYEDMVDNVERDLPDSNLVPVMEHFYNKKFHAYYLIPVLNIPTSMGFGKYSLLTGTVYNAFGPLTFQSFDSLRIETGFDKPDKIRALTVHEFGHSFANPAIDLLPASLKKETENLYTPLKEKMSSQGYPTWTICLYEHFVRAGENIINKKIAPAAEADKALRENIRGGFIYLPFIIAQLEQFDKNPDPHKNYNDFAVTILERLRDSVGKKQ